MNKYDSFESRHLLYRGISEQDADCLVKWRSDFGLIQYFKNPRPITLETHVEWFHNSYLHDNNRFDFMIFEKSIYSCEDGDKKIGTVGVTALNYHKKSCEISYMIADRNSQRKGFGSEAILALIRHVQKEGIRIFSAEIHRDNLASICTVEKLGFSQEFTQDDFIVYIKNEG